MANPLVPPTELGRSSTLTLGVEFGVDVWVTHASFQPSRSALALLLADLLAREAQFVVTIGNVRGVLDSSILDLEPGPDGPFISYSYYVTYDFVEDEDQERNASELIEATHPDSVLDEVCPTGPGSRVHLTQV